MDKRSQNLTELEAVVRDYLGPDTTEWIAKPSGLLDGMTPLEAAATPEGRQMVVHELRRVAAPLRKTLRKRRPAQGL